MANEDPKMKAGYRRHVFVCLNERDPGHPKGSCKHRGAEEVFRVLKEGASRAGLGADIRINRSGCMEHCAHGPTVVVYPEAVWYRLRSADDAALVLREHIIGGNVVHHLLIDNS